MRNFKYTINYAKKYILEKYNYLSIDINDNFFGCKYFKEKYYIFYLTSKNSSVYLIYRTDYTNIEKITLDISNYDDGTFNVILDWIMQKAKEKNESLVQPAKILKNSLVSYNGIYNIEDESNDLVLREVLNKNYPEITIEDLSINKTIKSLLTKNSITTLNQLLALNTDEIRKLKGINYYKTKILCNLIISIKKDPIKYINKINIEDNLSEEFISEMYSNQLVTDIPEFKEKLKKELVQNDVKTIADLLNISNYKLNLISKTSKSKIQKYKLDIIEKNRKIVNFKLYLEYIVSNYCSKERTIVSLKNFLERNTVYPVERLLLDLETLKNEDKIEYCLNGIRLKKIKLMNMLETFDENDKELLISRFSGNSLAEIAKKMKITRERVRQKVRKNIEKIKNVEEDKYKYYFEEYEFNKDIFCKIFNENEIVYYYLNDKYKRGKKTLIEAINDISFNEKQKNIIKEIFGVIDFNGKIIRLNFDEIINRLVEINAKEGIKLEDLLNLYDIFRNKYEKNNLKECSLRNLEAFLRRSSNVIFGNGNTIRYYNINSFDKYDINDIKDLYNLESGYYSTLFLYNNALDIMKKLDIRDEYELHYISRKIINSKNIKFDRMPNFSVGEVNKYKFIKNIMANLSPISINDFLEYIENHYGHKKTTMYSYILSKYPEYIKDNIIDCKLKQLSNDEIKTLKEIIIKPIYTFSELEKILNSAGFNETSGIITSGNIYKLGYKINSNYILKRDYCGIDEYFREMVNTKEFIPNENFLKINSYRNVMKKLEKNLDIFLISKNEYITIKKLSEIGITKEIIYRYMEEIKRNMSFRDAFTIYNIKEECPNSDIDELGFDDIFYESILSNIENIKTCKVGNYRLYSFLDIELGLKTIISNIIEEKNSIEIIELQEIIEEKYFISFESSKIKNCIKDTNYYYSEIMNKIYKNKNYYFEEVFNYE